jgi:hypothetical protein
MTYVPTPATFSQPQASFEAQELAREIEDLIIDYRRDHPRVRDADVGAAMRIAAMQTGASASRATQPLIAGVVAVLVAVLLALMLIMFRATG